MTIVLSQTMVSRKEKWNPYIINECISVAITHEITDTIQILGESLTLKKKGIIEAGHENATEFTIE